MVTRTASKIFRAKFLRDAFPYRAAFDEDRTVHCFDRDVPAIPGDPVRAILEGGLLQAARRLPSRRYDRRDG